jgi:hypothetical protein
MLKRLGQLISVDRLTAVVALLAAGSALYFTYNPDQRPFAPTDLRAHVKVDAIERGVTLDQWRWRVSVGNKDAHAKLLAEDPAEQEFHDGCGMGAEAGYLLYVDTDAKGFKKHSLSIRAALYDAGRRFRLPVADRYASLAKVPVQAPTAESVAEIWLWDPGTSRQLFARVELYAPHDQLIGFADSKRFPALTDPELRTLPQRCLPAPAGP